MRARQAWYVACSPALHGGTARARSHAHVPWPRARLLITRVPPVPLLTRASPALVQSALPVVCVACSSVLAGCAQFPYITAFPGPRSVVILDNAIIHHTHEFVSRVNECGGMVLYTPPYCFDCTPLDNGAFGFVKRYLQKHAQVLESVPLERALDKAFESVGKKKARYCFRLCQYL